MKRAIFGVTYAINTEASVEAGEHAEAGWIAEFVPLREAVEAVRSTRTNLCEGIAGIEADGCGARGIWSVTVSNGMEFETGANEERTLHMDRNLTPATRRRIARLVGAHAP